MYCAIGADLSDVDIHPGIQWAGFVPAGLHHGFKHTGGLPYHWALRTATELQCDDQCRLVHAVALHGPGYAGRPGGFVQS